MKKIIWLLASIQVVHASSHRHIDLPGNVGPGYEEVKVSEMGHVSNYSVATDAGDVLKQLYKEKLQEVYSLPEYHTLYETYKDSCITQAIESVAQKKNWNALYHDTRIQFRLEIKDYIQQKARSLALMEIIVRKYDEDFKHSTRYQLNKVFLLMEELYQYCKYGIENVKDKEAFIVAVLTNDAFKERQAIVLYVQKFLTLLYGKSIPEKYLKNADNSMIIVRSNFEIYKIKSEQDLYSNILTNIINSHSTKMTSEKVAELLAQDPGYPLRNTWVDKQHRPRPVYTQTLPYKTLSIITQNVDLDRRAGKASGGNGQPRLQLPQLSLRDRIKMKLRRFCCCFKKS